MDRARLQRIGQESVELAHDMALDVARKLMTALAASGQTHDNEIIRHIVASAFIAVGTAFLRRDGTSEEEAVDLVRGVYKGEEMSNG